ncbi:MAG TPA: helix-turn-helix domain-containing protein [Acidimicrobiales bacterium]|nr:helix-turn-helix domain-containing protein [Acidimicrobiales bacterium]
MAERVQWISTKEASLRLGVTLRSLYRFIDEGELAAYKFGRVIRLKEDDVDRYIDACRIAPGDLEHLYPARRPDGTEPPDDFAAADRGAGDGGPIDIDTDTDAGLDDEER